MDESEDQNICSSSSEQTVPLTDKYSYGGL